MSNQTSQNSPEDDLLVKRKKLLAAVTEEMVNSDDDDNGDGLDICKVVESQRNQIASSSDLRDLGETIRNTLLEINVIREQNRERRHKELMQVLLKMIDQENINIKSTNSNEHTPPSTQVTAQDYTENCLTVNRICENNNQNHIDSANASKCVSSKYIKMQNGDQETNQPQVCKNKIVAAKNADKELQQMRAQMLEIQRKKMEDRERKKREVT